MVAILQSITRHQDGSIDRSAWLNRLNFRYPREKLAGMEAALLQADAPCLEVATILLELYADPLAIQAALWLPRLYQSNREQLKALPVGAELLAILLNLYELLQVTQKLDLRKQKTLESMRRMLLAMIKDVRVALIQLALSTYQARNLKTFSLDLQTKMAEAIEVLYAPLANRLGLGQLKWELEDRAFSVLHAEAYQEITKALHERRMQREIFIQTWMETLETLLTELGLTVKVSGRIKHIASIWKKMQQKQLKFSALYDIRAVRILVPDVPSCYQVLAFLHERWTPLVSEYTDYIAHPKVNGYRSLHTVLKGEDQAAIEVQIRTFSMHEEAEQGIAAHWRYKEGGRHDLNLAERLNWLRMLLDWQKAWQVDVPAGKALEDNTVYVFTKDGDVVALPKGSTPIDFAFAVHTDLGLRCKGAYVNERIVPLNYPLAMTDQVEIITHKAAHPSRDWLLASEGFIQSSKARSKLKLWFSALEAKPAEKIELKERSETRGAASRANSARIGAKDALPEVLLAGMKGLPYQFAKCCAPLVNQDIVGYLSTQRGVMVHRQHCHYIRRLEEIRRARLLPASWEPLR